MINLWVDAAEGRERERYDWLCSKIMINLWMDAAEGLPVNLPYRRANERVRVNEV